MSQLSNALSTVPLRLLDQKLSSFQVQNYHCQSASFRFIKCCIWKSILQMRYFALKSNDTFCIYRGCVLYLPPPRTFFTTKIVDFPSKKSTGIEKLKYITMSRLRNWCPFYSLSEINDYFLKYRSRAQNDNENVFFDVEEDYFLIWDHPYDSQKNF